MRSTAAVRVLGAIDVRNVARDSLLRWIVILTPAFGLLFRFAVPPMADSLDRRFGFELVSYYPLLMSFLPLIAAGMTGTVAGFLLLDQRDDRTLMALLVTPLSLRNYLWYRLSGLTLLSAIFGALTMTLAGLTRITALQVGVTAVTAAPLSPIYALFFGTLASNKVQGFALAKAAGIVSVPCVAAYLITGPWQSAFGLVPHYWSMKAFWLFDQGATVAALVHALIGLCWQAALLMLLIPGFSHAVRR